MTPDATLGRITEALPRGLYRVQLENGTYLLAHISREMRLTYVRALPGDTVALEISAYDRSRGRITRRVRAQI